jgi:hypothetical protein
MNNIMTITFNEESTGDQSILLTLNNGTNDLFFMEQFQQTPRLLAGQIQVYQGLPFLPSPYTGTVGEYTATRYAQFFELDYSLNGLITVERTLNVVVLTVPSGYQWTNLQRLSSGEADLLNITYRIDSAAVNPFTLVSNNIVASTLDACNRYGIETIASSPIDKVFKNLIQVADNLNSNTFLWDTALRNQLSFLRLVDYSGRDIFITAFGAILIDINDFVITSIPGANGSTVTFYYNPPVQLIFTPPIFEYSLDGVNWFSETVLSNQEDGDYTLYVRDQFGCTKTKDYTVDLGSIRKPNHFISDANSINYVLQEDVDNCSSFRNQDNSFSYQDLNKHKFCDEILFNVCDKVPTQIKTNYTNIEVKLRKDQFSPEIPEIPGEPANSNLLLWSEAIWKNEWAKDDVTIGINAGTDLSDIMIPNTLQSSHNVSQLVSKPAEALTYTLSVYAKADQFDNYNRVYLRMTNDGESEGVAGWYNLDTGVWSPHVVLGAWSLVETNISAPDINGFYRVSLTVQSGTENSIKGTIGIVNNADEFGFIGDNSTGMEFYKIQLHQGPLTDYLPTTDSQNIGASTPGTPAVPASEMTEYIIPTLQQSTNLNRFQSLDGFIYSYAEGLSAIYFDSGNTYDEAGFENGTYSLGGNRPDFAVVGNLITVEGLGDFVIQQVLYDENIQKNVLIIQNNFVSLAEPVIVSSTFNLLPFEVVRFDIDFNEYGEGLYDVVIALTDNNFENVTYVSENIYVKENHENTIHVVYFNDNNRDIFYKYGIKNIIRLPYLKIENGVKDEITNNVGDFSSELVKSSTAKKDKYYLEALPLNIRFKAILAFGCEYLFINGVGYIKDSEAILEYIENTNLAYLSQELIKTNVNYNINNQNIIPLDDASMFDLPILIDQGSNLIIK